MTPALLILGGLLVFWASIAIIVIIPAVTFDPPPSEIWRPLTPQEKTGQRLYVRNGCSYCHSQFIRITDWGHGATRIAEAGDYIDRQPPLLGTERTGPDLSPEGGERPNDWHVAHFVNPRYTSPISPMPSWEFLGGDKIDQLTAYMQAEGGQGRRSPACWRARNPQRIIGAGYDRAHGRRSGSSSFSSWPSAWPAWRSI